MRGKMVFCFLSMAAVFFAAIAAHAATVTLALNPNSTTEPAGYKLYWGEISRETGAYSGEYDLGWHERDIPFDITLPLIQGTTYFFAATAYDNSDNESGYSAEVKKTVPAENRAPVAVVGSDQSVTEGLSVTLNGSGSYDPDVANALAYLWEQTSGEPVTLVNPATATASFTAPAVGADTDLGFRLTVTDNGSPILSNADNIIITVLDDGVVEYVTGATEDVALCTKTGGYGAASSVVVGGAVGNALAFTSTATPTVTTSFRMPLGATNLYHNLEFNFKIGPSVLDAWFVVEATVLTPSGNAIRKIFYRLLDTNTLGSSTNIYYGLGLAIKTDGLWHIAKVVYENLDGTPNGHANFNFVDIDYDLEFAQPANSLVSINTFTVSIKGPGIVYLDYLNLF